MNPDALQQRILELERENKILRKKLKRTQINLARVEEIKEKNDQFMRTVIIELREAQEIANKLNEELEQRVQQRTAALAEANDDLRREVEERTLAESRLREVNKALRYARDQALEASQTKSQFLARMSHELRTPLNAIIGYSELLEEELSERMEAPQLQDLQRIQISARHLLQLINDVLDLSKIEAGKMELRVESFALAPFLVDVVELVQPQAKKNHNQLLLLLDEDLPPLEADRVKLRQALLNLLSNAVKFTQQGTITLRASLTPEGKGCLLQVSDTGIGIRPQRLESIFEAFSQFDEGTSPKYGGTGLGLAISRLFCRMMGGELSVQSTLGEGSIFSIRLPLERDDAPPTDTQPTKPPLS